MQIDAIEQRPEMRDWYSSAHLGAREQAWAASSKCPQRQGRVAFFPFTPVTLKALRPLPYAKEPKTLGEHLKKRRHELGLFQKEVALRLGVDEWTIGNWEKGKTHPEIRHQPGIIAFLGYDPYPAPRTLGEWIAAKRREVGLSRKRAAKELGVDEGALARWERGTSAPKGRHLSLVAGFLVSGHRNLATLSADWRIATLKPSRRGLRDPRPSNKVPSNKVTRE